MEKIADKSKYKPRVIDAAVKNICLHSGLSALKAQNGAARRGHHRFTATANF